MSGRAARPLERALERALEWAGSARAPPRAQRALGGERALGEVEGVTREDGLYITTARGT